MNKDLFGNQLNNKTKLEVLLEKQDKETLDGRARRLKYLIKIFPKEYLIVGELQNILIFNEAKLSYINGQFISTILLSQAFIEKKLESYYIEIGLKKIASKGFGAIINHAKENKILHEFLLNKINKLRKIRNPFVHLKPSNHEYNLNNRLFTNLEKKDNLIISEILEKDAKNALSLMFAIFITDFGN